MVQRVRETEIRQKNGGQLVTAPRSDKKTIVISAYQTDQIDAKHLYEWLNSAVDPGIIAANVRSISGYEIYNFVGSEHMSRLNSGRLSTRWTRRYGHLEHGAWQFAGLDPITGERMEWGCLKPDHPFIKSDSKPLKYEHPYKVPTRVFIPANPHDEDYLERTKSDTSIDITITEGAKKAACLLSHGHVTIGLPGVTGAVRKDESTGKKRYFLIPDFEAFEWKERRVNILFDHDQKASTRRNVEIEIAKLSKQLKLRGAKPYVVSLPGKEKGVDDFVMARGAEALEKLYDEALPFEAWEVRQYQRLTYPVAQQVSHRFLDVQIPTQGLVGIKSPKGTGKTESIAKVVQSLLDDCKRILFITHRVQLGETLGKRVGLPYVSELGSVGEGDLFGYVLCADSMVQDSQARFSPAGWDAVIIDEAEQVLWHILDSRTEIENRRIPVLENLQQVLSDQLTGEGLVVLMDADLTDVSIDFVKDMGGVPDLVPYIIENAWTPDSEAWNVYNYEQNNPEALYAQAIDLLDQDQKLIIFTHSQQAKGRWSTRTLEKCFARRYPGKKILRIDSQSISEPGHPACGCIPVLNEILGLYDIVIASPSLETGVSIDIRGHFDAVLGFFSGVTPADSVRQTLSRVRDSIDRYIWVAKRGLRAIDNGSTSAQELLDSQRKKASYHVRQLAHLSEVSLNEDAIETNAPLKVWAKLAARINAGIANYRETVISGLASEGHHILKQEAIGDRDLTEELIQCRDEGYEAHCAAIAQAENITPRKYEELKSKKSKSEEEWHQQKKYFLQQRYQCQDISPEMIAQDDKGWHSKLRLHYFLGVGRDHLNHREVSKFQTSICNGKVWQPTLNRGQLGLKMALIEFLGIRQLLDPLQTYHKNHDAVLAVASAARANRWLVRTALGVSASEQASEIQICQSLLGLLGLKLKGEGRPGGRGEARVRLYRFVDPEDDREGIFERWLERDEAARQSHEEAIVSTPGINKNLGEAAA
jgi:hypothetical protein